MIVEEYGELENKDAQLFMQIKVVSFMSWHRLRRGHFQLLSIVGNMLTCPYAGAKCSEFGPGLV